MQTPTVQEAASIVISERPSAAAGKTVLQLDHVHGIRGLLTIGILLAHVRTMLIYVPLKNVNFDLLAGTTVWMWPAFYSVGMFVAISGYCLMLPVVRTKDGRFRGGVPDYLHRRIRRMLPPYYVALAIYLVLRCLMPKHPYLGHNTLDSGSIATHLMMVQNLFQKFRYSIDAPCWTVASEWQLYLLFPFVLLPVWRRFGIPALLALAALLGALPTLVGGDAVNYHSWYIFIFAVGMCGAAIQYYDRPQETRLRKIMPWGRLALLLLGSFGILCFVDIARHHKLIMEYIPDWKRFCVYELLAGLACVALMVYCGGLLKPVAGRHSSVVMRFLTHPWFTVVGMFSYSHYLLHYPVLTTIRWITQLMKLSSPTVIFVMYFIAIPISLSVGYLFFLLVERWFLPSHLRKDRLASKPAGA